MAQLTETRPHGPEMLVLPARTRRLALLVALGIAIALALGIELPTAPDGMQDAARVTPISERTYDGQGKWTGY